MLCQIDAKELTEGDYPSLKTSDIGSIEIPLPPLEIQEQIVKNIEGLQNDIEVYKEGIKNKQEEIKNKINEVWGSEIE